MKRLVLLLGLLATTPAFAAASRAERELYCRAIDAALEEEQADMAMVTKACLRSARLRAKPVEGGGREIFGPVKFNSPARRGFDMRCAVIYTPPIKRGVKARVKECAP